MTNYPAVGSDSDTTQTVQNITGAFNSVCEAEDKLDKIEVTLLKSFPDTYDMCNISSFTDKLGNIAEDLSGVQKSVTSALSNMLSNTIQGNTEEPPRLNIDAKYTNFLSTQIVLKRFQILKYKIEKIKKSVQIIEAKTVKSILTSFLKGKGSAANPTLSIPMLTIQALAQVVNIIMQVINVIITLVSSITIISVDAAGMCFFMTPKSMNTAKMNILNVKKSINDTIPDPISKSIATVQQKTNESNGLLKMSRIGAMSAAGAATAGANFNPGEFGSLEAFNPKIIKTATNAILMTLVDAEPIPRFEKLSIINIRFMVWLVTGFVPSGKKSFGIPGYS